MPAASAVSLTQEMSPVIETTASLLPLRTSLGPVIISLKSEAILLFRTAASILFPKKSAAPSIHDTAPEIPPLTGIGSVGTPFSSLMNAHRLSVNWSSLSFRQADALPAREMASMLVIPGRTQHTSTPRSSRTSSTVLSSLMALLDIVLVPTSATESSILSPPAENLLTRPTPASMVPCMKSPAAFPSSSSTATLASLCLLSKAFATASASSPMMPGGQAVMTAKSLFPRAYSSSRASLSDDDPPKIIVPSSMLVHLTSGLLKVPTVS